jgi:hypothetical protein
MDETAQAPRIEGRDIDDLGTFGGVIDEISLVEQVDRKLGTDPRELVSCGRGVKAMILNGWTSSHPR